MDKLWQDTTGGLGVKCMTTHWCIRWGSNMIPSCGEMLKQCLSNNMRVEVKVSNNTVHCRSGPPDSNSGLTNSNTIVSSVITTLAWYFIALLLRLYLKLLPGGAWGKVWSDYIWNNGHKVQDLTKEVRPLGNSQKTGFCFGCDTESLNSCIGSISEQQIKGR